MKKYQTVLKCFVAVGAFCFTGGVQAAGPFGLGLIVGDPTGVSAKYNLSDVDAIDAGLGWSLTNDNHVHLHVDYLRHCRNAFRIKDASFDFYYGGGLRFTEHENSKKREDEGALGVRVPFGVDYVFNQVPVEVFFELVPIVDLVPDTEFDLNVGLGGRYYF